MTGPFDLHGKVVLAMGGSRGFGAAIARMLAKQGADVTVTSRRVGGCTDVVRGILADGGTAREAVCHLGEPDQIRHTIDPIIQDKGRLNVLVNDAATNPYFGAAVDTDFGALQKTIDVKIRGFFLSTAHAAQAMAANGGGSIVNIGSINAVIPGPQQGIYSVTKAAIEVITKVFAAECGEAGVRVNTVLPGITDTSFATALVESEELLSQYLKRIPLGRVADPDDIAGAVSYLASDAARYTTGSSIVVDGGYLVR